MVVRRISTGVLQIWRAIDNDEVVPEVQHLMQHKALAVWRKALQPHFQTPDAEEAAFLHQLMSGRSIDEAANTLAGTAVLPEPQRLGGWFQAWLAQGLLRDQSQRA